MSSTPLQARSMMEIQLYLRVTPCALCGKGPLRCDNGADRPNPTIDDARNDQSPTTFTLCCTACSAVQPQPLGLVHPASPAESADSAMINPTGEPSRIIDLGQWLVLVSLLMNEAGRETNPVRARELGIRAAQCLDEALKFYTDAENDLPPSEAFFNEESRKRFHDSPEKFSRRRVAGMKSSLPHPYIGS